MYKSSRAWIFMTVTMIFFPAFVRGSETDFQKAGELYYQIFRNNERIGYAHTEFHEKEQDKVKWVRIIQEKKEEIVGWLSKKTSEDHTTILLKNNTFYSMKSKGKKNGDPYEVHIQSKDKGLELVIIAQKKIKEGLIRRSEYDYTSIDSPYLYLKKYNTPYNLNILDLPEYSVVRSQITLMRKEKMEDLNMQFDCWVIRVENPLEKRTDWITPDGILIQSSGKNREGSFLIRATSKAKATAGY